MRTKVDAIRDILGEAETDTNGNRMNEALGGTSPRTVTKSMI